MNCITIKKTSIIICLFGLLGSLSWQKIINHEFYIVLTFDDGPYLGYTEKILDILNRHNVVASFFVTGQNVKKYPTLVYKIYKEGHTIGLHGYNHIDYTKLSKKQILVELNKAKQTIENIIGKDKIKYFRPPAGKWNHLVKQCCDELGLELVLWTVYPLDYGEKNPKKIFDRIKNKKFSQYEILLLHNGVPATIEVLEDLIKYIRLRKGKFITLQEFYNAQKERR